jgi:hypothetical protein
MSYENISASLSAADKGAIKQAIQTILSKLPMLINFSDEERRGRLVLGDKSVAFAMKVVEYTKSHPQFMPGDVSIPELHKDWQLYLDIIGILQLLKPLVMALEDTELAVGNEAYHAVLAYYNNSRAAAERNSPGARGVYTDQREKYPNLSTGRPANVPKVENPPQDDGSDA